MAHLVAGKMAPQLGPGNRMKNIWLIWVSGVKNARYVGKSMEEIGTYFQGNLPFDAAVDILIDENGGGHGALLWV